MIYDILIIETFEKNYSVLIAMADEMVVGGRGKKRRGGWGGERKEVVGLVTIIKA